MPAVYCLTQVYMRAARTDLILAQARRDKKEQRLLLRTRLHRAGGHESASDHHRSSCAPCYIVLCRPFRKVVADLRSSRVDGHFTTDFGTGTEALSKVEAAHTACSQVLHVASTRPQRADSLLPHIPSSADWTEPPCNEQLRGDTHQSRKAQAQQHNLLSQLIL